MKFTEYIKDKILLFVLHICCMLALAGFLRATEYPGDLILLILVAWILILAVWLIYGYSSRKRYFDVMERTIEKVDQRYLLGELMPDSHRLEDHIYRALIRSSNKSVIERIHRIKDEQKEYREYIESWVHEVKAPITSIALMCENSKNEGMAPGEPGNSGAFARRISIENQKIENYVEMALYYARSDEVYKDYVIHETDLQETAIEVLKRNKRYLIQNHIQAEVSCPDKVYTDEKWISFILNQLILNSAKYRSGEDAHIWIFTERRARGIDLIVRDNGIGIRENELPRIFEKGFTGSNGRQEKRSTGMGLYLCQKLCRKLGIRIRARSQEAVGTEIILEFPLSDFLSKL